MTVEYDKAGGYVISDIINGHLVTRHYWNYTRAESIRRFKREYKK